MTNDLVPERQFQRCQNSLIWNKGQNGFFVGSIINLRVCAFLFRVVLPYSWWIWKKTRVAFKFNVQECSTVACRELKQGWEITWFKSQWESTSSNDTECWAPFRRHLARILLWQGLLSGRVRDWAYSLHGNKKEKTNKQRHEAASFKRQKKGIIENKEYNNKHKWQHTHIAIFLSSESPRFITKHSNPIAIHVSHRALIALHRTRASIVRVDASW